MTITELYQLMESMMQYDGPVYFRVSRQSVETIVPKGYHFKWGKGVVLLHGTDMTIMGTGIASHWALTAAKQLAVHGINARVVHMPCLKPFDRELAIKAATETGAIVTVENHSIIGGLGSAVCEILSEEYPVPVKRIGVHDEFVESGEDDELIEKYGLSIENIVKSSIDIMTIKKGKSKTE